MPLQTESGPRSRKQNGPALTSKILAVTDALGYLVRSVILPGQAHDLAGTSELLEGLPFEALIGDRAFDVGWLVEDVKGRGSGDSFEAEPEGVPGP